MRTWEISQYVCATVHTEYLCVYLGDIYLYCLHTVCRGGDSLLAFCISVRRMRSPGVYFTSYLAKFTLDVQCTVKKCMKIRKIDVEDYINLQILNVIIRWNL
jgi:hypothetical protein